MNQPENMTLQATIASRKPETAPADIRQKLEWPGRICILLAIAVAPWLYGGVFFSAQFMMAICCLIGIGLLWFESGVSERRSLILPYLMVPVFFGIVLALIQIIPLGESFHWLLGKQVELYPLLTGNNQASPSISMSTSDTWDQIGLLTIAFAGLCLGSRYFRSTGHVKLLLAIFTVVGVALSLFGLVHSLTSEPGTIFWTVELTGGGSPFGPYVNRNNAAGFLLICLGASLGLITITVSRERRGPKPLGTKDLPFWTQFKNHSLRFIAELNATKIATLLATMVIVLGMIGTLSRGGVLSMLAGAITTLLLYGMARRPSFSAFIFFPACGISILLAFWLGFGDQLINRMESVRTVEVLNQKDIRIEHWKDTWPATSEFGILGSGIGAYDEVHRIYNRGSIQVVFRYAENQFFQALVELGWPGLILLLCTWSLTLYYALFLLYRGSSHSTIGIGVAALFVTVSVGIASIFDFGLYLPANMLLMSVFCGFVGYHAQSLSSRLKKRNWLCVETPNSVAQIVLLVTFATLAMFALDFYRKSQIQSVVRGQYPVKTFTYNNPDLAETDRLIGELKPKVEQTRYSEGVDYMARLLIHRCRLEAMAKMTDGAAEEPKRLWNRTSLDLMQETAWALQRDGRIFSAAEFLRSDFIRNNLPWARQYLLENRAIDPMEPHTHLMLGQVNAIVGKASTASEDIERAIMLAPSQIDLKYLAGFYYLQTGNQKQAARHLRDLLENMPQQFKQVMKVIFGGSNRNLASISDMTVAKDIIPDNPRLLYELAKNHLKPGSQAKSLALTRSERLLTNLSASDRELLLLKSNVLYEKGEYADAIEQFESYLDSRPQDYTIHFRVAKIHMMLSDLETAEAKLNYLLRMADDPKLKSNALKLLEQIGKQKKSSEAKNAGG